MILYGDIPQFFFAGSCRSNVEVNGAIADPPTADEQEAIKRIGHLKTSNESISGMTYILSLYQMQLQEIDKRKGHCFVGGPYDTATWEEGRKGWNVNLGSSCNSIGP